MRKDNEGNFRTFWFRYDGYEIREIDEKHYITPKENYKIILKDNSILMNLRGNIRDDIYYSVTNILMNLKKDYL